MTNSITARIRARFAILVRLDNYLVQEVVDKNDQLLPITSGSTHVTPPTTAPVTTPASSAATTTTLTAGAVHYPW
jgi:hypothetical protein